jgi:ankyrin repeat protein
MYKDVGVLPWVQMYNVDELWDGINLSLTTKDMAQPLYYAALIGVLEVIENIIPLTADVNAHGGYYGHALQAASARGHEKVVQMLLDTGANVNAHGGYYGHALQAASARGHEKVVQMLLDAGADVNAHGGGDGHALQAAS